MEGVGKNNGFRGPDLGKVTVVVGDIREGWALPPRRNTPRGSLKGDGGDQEERSPPASITILGSVR